MTVTWRDAALELAMREELQRAAGTALHAELRQVEQAVRRVPGDLGGIGKAERVVLEAPARLRVGGPALEEVDEAAVQVVERFLEAVARHLGEEGSVLLECLQLAPLVALAKIAPRP